MKRDCGEQNFENLSWLTLWVPELCRIMASSQAGKRLNHTKRKEKGSTRGILWELIASLHGRILSLTDPDPFEHKWCTTYLSLKTKIRIKTSRPIFQVQCILGAWREAYLIKSRSLYCFKPVTLHSKVTFCNTKVEMVESGRLWDWNWPKRLEN